MSSQGAVSTKNGKELQRRWFDLLKSKGIQVVEEHLTGITNALADDKRLRCDLFLPEENIIIECKNHSGQPGTIYQKIPYSFLTYRATRTPVVFLLGLGFDKHPYQIRALQRAAEFVSPLITIVLESDIEQRQRASTEPKSVFAGLVPN